MPGCIHTYVYSSVKNDVGLDVVVYVVFRTPKQYIYIYTYYYVIFYIYIYIYIIEIWNTVTSVHSYTDMAATK